MESGDATVSRGHCNLSLGIGGNNHSSAAGSREDLLAHAASGTPITVDPHQGPLTKKNNFAGVRLWSLPLLLVVAVCRLVVVCCLGSTCGPTTAETTAEEKTLESSETNNGKDLEIGGSRKLVSCQQDPCNSCENCLHMQLTGLQPSYSHWHQPRTRQVDTYRYY